MRRRALLTGATAGIVAPMTGCLAGFEDPGEGDDDGTGDVTNGDSANDPDPTPDEPTGEWLKFQANAAHTGATTESGPEGGGRVRWWSDTS